MQDKEATVTTVRAVSICSRRIASLICKLTLCHADDCKWLDSYTLVCISRGEERTDVYALKGRLEEYIDPRILSYNYPLIPGVHVAIIAAGQVALLLGLLQILRLESKITKGYAVINRQAEKLFLYGRDVLPGSIVELSPPPYSECVDRVAVLSLEREPLGWGRLIRRGNRIYIQNLVDAGWYLRSGV